MIGERLAIGRTSQVYAVGNDSVAKVLEPGVPEHWASVEAVFTRAVRDLGVPAPEVREVTVVDGRPAVVFERITGQSMWERLIERPADITALVRDFAAVQRLIHRAGVPVGLPGKVERMADKIADVDVFDPVDRDTAISMAESFPRGAALLHGDFHPGNVLLSENGPMVIDWFDATVGHPVFDVVRSWMLMTSRGATDLRHLPGVRREQLEPILDEYLRQMSDVIDAVGPAIADWRAVTAVSRLAERTDSDTAGLLALWRARLTPTQVG